MPYMKVYKGKDGLWHDSGHLKYEDIVDFKLLGILGEKDPEREEFCKECFPFLFKVEKHEHEYPLF